MFEKTEFYSDLKKQAVSDDEYESSLHLSKTLKMRNLGDMNDLCDAQDVIIILWNSWKPISIHAWIIRFQA